MRSREFIQEIRLDKLWDLGKQAVKKAEPPRPRPREDDINRLVSPQEAMKAKLGMKLMNGPKRVPLPGSNGMNIVKTSGSMPRIVVVVDVDGIPMPFYISTGGGGKENVPTGRWYEFWGIGPNGWFNKTSEADILNHYGSAKLKAICDQLDSTVGDIRNMADIIPVMTAADKQVINTAKQPIDYPPTMGWTQEQLDQWQQRIRNMGRSL